MGGVGYCPSMGWGNGRVPAGADRMLGIIKRRGPQRAADLASALGVTAEAARQQLVQLAQAELVSSETPKRGVGRPSRVWSLTAAGHARFPDTHAELTVQLIGAIRGELGDRALDRIIKARQEEIRKSYRAALEGARTLGTRVARLPEIRAPQGSSAAWPRPARGLLSVATHSPTSPAAT